MVPQSMGSEGRGTSDRVCSARHRGSSRLAKVWPQTLRYPWFRPQRDRAAAQREGASPVAEVFCLSKEFVVRGVGRL